jgi:hypothetical protein
MPREINEPSLSDAVAKTHAFVYEKTRQTGYAVSFTELLGQQLTDQQRKARIDTMPDRLASANNAEVISRDSITLRDAIGLEIVLEPNDEKLVHSHAHVRVYSRKNILYQLMVTGTKAEVKDMNAERFLQSFRFIDKK